MKFTDEQLLRLATCIKGAPGVAHHLDGKPWDEERGALAREVLRLRAEARRGGGTPEWLSEALNSGDGTYKP